MRGLKRGTAIIAAVVFCLTLLVPWTSLAGAAAASGGAAQPERGPQAAASTRPGSAVTSADVDSRAGEKLEVDYEINPGGATTNSSNQEAYRGFMGSNVVMAVQWVDDDVPEGTLTYTWEADPDFPGAPALSAAPEPASPGEDSSESESDQSRAAAFGPGGSARSDSAPPENYSGPKTRRVTAVPTQQGQWAWHVSAWNGTQLIDAISVRLVVAQASLSLVLSPNDSTAALGANIAAVPVVGELGQGVYTITVYSGSVQAGHAIGTSTVTVPDVGSTTGPTFDPQSIPLPTGTPGTTTYSAAITRQNSTTVLAEAAAWSVTVLPARLVPVRPTISILSTATGGLTTLAAAWDTDEGYAAPAWAEDADAKYVWTMSEGAPEIVADYEGGQYLTNKPTTTLKEGVSLPTGTYTYTVQALQPSTTGGASTPISAPAATITLSIYADTQLVPTRDVVTTGIGEEATLSVEWVAGSDPTGQGGTILWTPQETGAPALAEAAADGTLRNGRTVTTLAATSAGTFHYKAVPCMADGTALESKAATVTLVVSPATDGQPTAISYTLPYPGSATAFSGTTTNIIAGQTTNLPTLVVDPDPSDATVAWFGPYTTPDPPQNQETPAGSGSEFQLTATSTLQSAGAGTRLYYFAVISNEVGSETLSLTIPFTVAVQAAGEQSLVSTTNDTPEGSDIPVVMNSNSPTAVSVAWLPGLEPEDVTAYRWTVSQAPSGGTFTVQGTHLAPVSGCAETLNGSGIYTVNRGSVWTTPKGVLDFSTASFTAEGRYIISYEVLMSSATREGTRTGTIPLVVGAVSAPVASGQYTYSIAKGYFPGTSTAPIILPGDYPANPVTTAGGGTDWSATNPLVIGPQGFDADGQSTALDLNDRVELYWNPDNIIVQLGGSREHLNNVPGTSNYWENWVSMVWRYRPSQQIDGGGNALTIPDGLGYSGINSPLLVVSPLTADMEGLEYALEIHVRGNEHLYTTTPWVHLDINGIAPGTIPSATLTTYPAPSGSRVTVPVGGQVSFITSVQSSIAPENTSYQWQSLQPPSGDDPYPSWVDIDGAHADVLTFSSVSAAQNDVQYRCRVTNISYATGVTGYTEGITLQVRPQSGSIVFSSPIAASLVNLYAGRTCSMSCGARADDGAPVTYQWYVKSYHGSVPGGQQGILTGEPIATVSQAAAYLAASGSNAVSGATTNALTTEPLEEGVYQFTCRVQNQNDASQASNSEPVYVVVTQESRRPYITKPAGSYTDVGVANGQAITMECEAWVASGENMTYQWQTSTTPASSSSWADLTSTSPTLTIASVTESYSGSYYRCIVSNPAAGEARVSGCYHLNVWNVANTPVVQTHPVDVETHMYGLPEVTIPHGATVQGVQLTSSATVAQSNTQGRPMTAIWYRASNGAAVLNGSADAYGNRYYVDQATTSDGQYLSYLTITGMAGNKNAARSASDGYYCVWYKPQLESSTVAPQPFVGPLASVHLAPQARSSTATVSITVPGDPSIATLSAPQSAAVGTSATFSISATLAANATGIPQGSLVYTWQMTEDGGATWRNCLSSDGNGQYSSSFTTVPLTRTMYENSTASNVIGTGSGAPGNARTVYMYRCIIANRTTGARVHTSNLPLIITDGTEAPSPSPSPSQSPSSTPSESPTPSEPTGERPSIDPGSGPVHVTGSGSSRYVVGPEVSRYGCSAEAYVRELNQTLPSGYSFVIEDPDGYVISGSEIVGTGMTLFIRSQTGTNADSATIIIPGDVRGTGVLNITQLVAMAQDVSGERLLSGPYAMAADLNDNGRIDIGDLVLEARLFL